METPNIIDQPGIYPLSAISGCDNSCPAPEADPMQIIQGAHPAGTPKGANQQEKEPYICFYSIFWLAVAVIAGTGYLLKKSAK